MAVDDALRMPGRARGVAHRHRGALVELGPDEIIRFRGEQVRSRNIFDK